MKLACGDHCLAQQSRTMVLEHFVLGNVKLMNEENVYNQANAKGWGEEDRFYGWSKSKLHVR